jgi:hypothetical protein
LLDGQPATVPTHICHVDPAEAGLGSVGTVNLKWAVP